MAKLTDLRPEVLPHVSGCPAVMVDDAILKTVIDFCNRSRAYRFSPDAIAVSSGVADYDPDLPNDSAIAWLLAATLDGSDLDVAQIGSALLIDDGSVGTPSKAIVVSDAEIGLRSAPSASGTLKLSLALRPSKTARTYPDELHVLYQEHIAAGVLAKLWSQPNQPWSSAGMVQDARERYESGISLAEYRADRSSSSTPPRTALSLIGGR